MSWYNRPNMTWYDLVLLLTALAWSFILFAVGIVQVFSDPQGACVTVSLGFIVLLLGSIWEQVYRR